MKVLISGNPTAQANDVADGPLSCYQSYWIRYENFGSKYYNILQIHHDRNSFKRNHSEFAHYRMKFLQKRSLANLTIGLLGTGAIGSKGK